MAFVFSKEDTEEALTGAILMLETAEKLALMAKGEEDIRKKEKLADMASNLADEGRRLSRTVKRSVAARTVLPASESFVR
jgi:hypothetical protein